MMKTKETPQAPPMASLPPSSHTPAPYTGPSRDEVLAMRRQYLTPGLITYYREPLLLVEGHMQYLWDETGKQYLDAFAGIVTVSVGHCHPHIVEKVREQVGRLQHTTTIYLHPAVAEFGRRLAGKMPPGSDLSVSYFTNSGSEANEIAVLSSREFTGNVDVISLRNGYHGGTQAAMALTAHGTWKFKTNPTVGVKHATPGYCYRCPFGLEYPSCDVKCARDVEDLIRFETPGEVACFIAEPIQGVGGVVTPPPEYFQIVYDIVRQARRAVHRRRGADRLRPHRHQVLGIRELGRDSRPGDDGQGNRQRRAPGRMRHAAGDRCRHEEPCSFQHIRRQPDLDDAGAGDARGDRKRGNPAERPAASGKHLKDRLLELQERQPLIGEVRGMGLMLGVELVRDRVVEGTRHNRDRRVLELCKERGLLDRQGGPGGQHAADQAADVPDARRCRLPGGLPG